MTAGVFHRHKVGLRQLCRSHPQSVRVLNRFIAAICPNFFHTSFVAIDGIASREHKDHLNSDLPNVVIPLCAFKGGELVVAHESAQFQGCCLPAVVLEPRKGPMVFSAASCWHRVSGFSGRRLVLAIYTLRACNKASYQDRCILFRIWDFVCLRKGISCTHLRLCLITCSSALKLASCLVLHCGMLSPLSGSTLGLVWMALRLPRVLHLIALRSI